MSKWIRRYGKRRLKKEPPPLPKNKQGMVALPVLIRDPEVILPENVEDFKQSDCKYYYSCLTYASRLSWDQFHCNSCKIYEHDPNIDKLFEKFSKLINTKG